MIDGVAVRVLRQIHDERGYLMEMLRSDWPAFDEFGQGYVTTAYPGVVKGWHYHKAQTDNFIVLKGTAKVVCYDNREDSKTKGEVDEFLPGERNSLLLTIPPLVLHGFKALGSESVYLVNPPTRLYNYEEPDESRLPYDSGEVPYDWNLQMRQRKSPLARAA